MLAEMGITESGLDQLARVGFDTLGLQTYLTAGPKETRAWTIRKGATAPEAAGVDPHRLPEGLHQGRDRLLRRPGRRRLHAQGQGGRQGAHGGQGLRHGRRRRGGVPLQRVNVRVCAGQRGCRPLPVRTESARTSAAWLDGVVSVAQSPDAVQPVGTPVMTPTLWRRYERSVVGRAFLAGPAKSSGAGSLPSGAGMDFRKVLVMDSAALGVITPTGFAYGRPDGVIVSSHRHPWALTHPRGLPEGCGADPFCAVTRQWRSTR